MTPDSILICLITPGHVTSTPRLVKHANALAAAGYRVHVVAGRHFPPADPLDAKIFAAARWSHTLVDVRGGAGVLALKVLRLAARLAVRYSSAPAVAVAARAHQVNFRRFAAAAARQPAKLYLGHCLAGLPAAAFAARARGVPYGFDAEDFHDAETDDALSDSAESAARRILQSRLLPGCALVTAASPLIAKAYENAYGIRPLSILNVFPLADAPAMPVDPGPVSDRRPATLYWFSQTIGAGRGLERAIAVLGRMQTPAELHLRGFVSPGEAARLQALARAAGAMHPLRFLPPGPPAEMARLAATADLGLSTEESLPLNRDLCLTNKIFVYLLAGIPQLLTTTAAQKALAPELGDAALLVDLDRPEEAARRLDGFFSSASEPAAGRRAAWTLARGRFNWDLEQAKFLGAVRAIPGLS